MLLEKKVVVITGGAGLLGQTFAECVISNGGIAVIADISADKAMNLSKALNERSKLQVSIGLQIDICSKESVLNAINEVHSRYGYIDAWINSAYPRNANYGRQFFDVELSDFCENVNINLGGYFLCCQQIAGYFKTQGAGNIINISSIYGVIAPRFEVYEGTRMTMPVEYAVIKSSLLHLTKFMAKQFKGMNIRVNAISPGGIFDNQPQPFVNEYKKFCLNKGMLDRKDLQGAALFLMSDQSKYVNGQNIIVDDGFTL